MPGTFQKPPKLPKEIDISMRRGIIEFRGRGDSSSVERSAIGKVAGIGKALRLRSGGGAPAARAVSLKLGGVGFLENAVGSHTFGSPYIPYPYLC